LVGASETQPWQLEQLSDPGIPSEVLNMAYHLGCFAQLDAAPRQA